MVGQELMIAENKELIKAVADVYRLEKEITAKKKVMYVEETPVKASVRVKLK